MSEPAEKSASTPKTIAQFLGKADADVTITKGLQYYNYKPNATRETITINVASDTSDNAKNLATSESLSKFLKSIPELRQYVSTETPEESQLRVKSELQSLLKDGVELPANIGEWRAVDPKIGGNTIPEHVLDINHSDERGTNITIRIPKQEGKDNGPELASFVKKLNENLEAAKTTLIARAEKYNLKDDDKIALGKLEFEVSSNEADKHSEVFISIRSPEQREAKNANHELSPEELTKLKATNPLNKLDEKQRGKALGHAFLLHEKKLRPEFTPYLGTSDMSALLRRVAKHYEKSHEGDATQILQMLVDKKAITPDQQQHVLDYAKEHNMLSGEAAVKLGCVTQDVLDSALKEQAPHKAAESVKARLASLQKEELLIDRQQWNRPVAERQEWKTPPLIGVNADHPNRVGATLVVKVGEGEKVHELLNKYMPAKDKSCQMMSVDSIEPVAVVSPHPEVKEATKDLIGKQMAPTEAGDKLLAALSKAQSAINEKLVKPVERVVERAVAAITPEETKHNKAAINEIDAALAALPQPIMSPHRVHANGAHLGMGV